MAERIQSDGSTVEVKVSELREGDRVLVLWRNIDTMEMKVVLRQVQPNGLSVTKEVNFMTAARQL